jgi:hypothetical protein
VAKPKHKCPGFGARVVELKKHTRLGAAPEQAEHSRPVWRVGLIDWEGPYGWGALESAATVRELWARLRDFESMTWVDIGRAGSHNVALDQLSTEARARLAELKLDDVDELFSLRLAGKLRAWGFREANVLRFLWWDPDHQVCPAPLRNT